MVFPARDPSLQPSLRTGLSGPLGSTPKRLAPREGDTGSCSEGTLCARPRVIQQSLTHADVSFGKPEHGGTLIIPVLHMRELLLRGNKGVSRIPQPRVVNGDGQARSSDPTVDQPFMTGWEAAEGR